MLGTVLGAGTVAVDQTHGAAGALCPLVGEDIICEDVFRSQESARTLGPNLGWGLCPGNIPWVSSEG